MRRQSSKIFYRGVQHNEIVFDGHYHDEMWKDGVCIWKKLSGGFPSAAGMVAGYGLMGLIGTQAYTVSGSVSGGMATVKVTPWTAGQPGQTRTEQRSYTGSSRGYYGAGHMIGALLAANDRHYTDGSQTGAEVIYSLDGQNFSSLFLPVLSSDYGSEILLTMGADAYSRMIAAGYLDGYIIMRGGANLSGTTGKALSYFIIDPVQGVSTAATGNTYSGSFYYRDIFHDQATGKLYAVKVRTGNSGGSDAVVVGTDLVEITSLAGGSAAERTICTLSSSSTVPALEYIHAANGEFFYRYGSYFRKINQATGSYTNTRWDGAARLQSYHSCVGNAVYSSGRYEILVWDMADQEFTGYTSSDGQTWAADQTISIGSPAFNGSGGNSISAGGYVYTGEWNGNGEENGFVVYAAE